MTGSPKSPPTRYAFPPVRRVGGTGRRDGLKNRCPHGRVGSSPTLGTRAQPPLRDFRREVGAARPASRCGGHIAHKLWAYPVSYPGLPRPVVTSRVGPRQCLELPPLPPVTPARRVAPRHVGRSYAIWTGTETGVWLLASVSTVPAPRAGVAESATRIRQASRSTSITRSADASPNRTPVSGAGNRRRIRSPPTLVEPETSDRVDISAVPAPRPSMDSRHPGAPRRTHTPTCPAPYRVESRSDLVVVVQPRPRQIGGGFGAGATPACQESHSGNGRGRTEVRRRRSITHRQPAR